MEMMKSDMPSRQDEEASIVGGPYPYDRAWPLMRLHVISLQVIIIRVIWLNGLN